MPYNPADLCQLVQQSLNATFTPVSGENARHANGFLTAIQSPKNVNAVDEPLLLDSRDGKGPKTVELEYMRRATPDDTHTDNESFCEDGVEISKLYVPKQINKFVRSQNLKFSDDEMRKLCEGSDEFRARVFRLQIDAFLTRVNRIAIAEAIAGKGGLGAGAAPAVTDRQMLEVDGTQTANNPMGEILIAQDYAKMGHNERPFMVGAGKLDTYARLADIGCCDQYGHDISETANVDYYYDLEVDKVAGTSDNIITFVPGAIQMATWLKNKGAFQWDHAHFTKDTIVLPDANGLEVDWNARYDECKDHWIVQMSLHFGVFPAPLDMYSTGDDNEGFNGVLMYKATAA